MRRLRKAKCTIRTLKKNADIVENLRSPILKDFLTAAHQNQKRKPKGRRWTAKNKISALAIYKRSPKTYRYLQHVMPLPSIKTLQNLLKRVPMEPGISESTLRHLQKSVNEDNKLCSIVFDEIALKRSLILNEAADKVEGYEDMGGSGGRSDKIADHALVFMLQGVRAKFKQPIAFYFVKGTITSIKLASLIKEIIEAVERTGFRVMATICDQGPTNVGGLNLLKGLRGPDNKFQIGAKTIYILYDVPHLFKSLRNNFLNHGTMVMDGKVARWAHLQQVEEKNRTLLYLSKITAVHVMPKYRAKMRVKFAAQILSNTVAAVLKLISGCEQNPEKSRDIMETAVVVQSLDRLFDATNGPLCPDDIKKGLRENVSTKSNHVNVWADLKEKVLSIKFKNPDGKEAKNIKCVKGYVITLTSLEEIWGELRKFNFKYMNLRNFNQDALENLFGVIRQHCPTNKHPTCSAFTAALKSTVITGMTAPHSKGSNCEKDGKHVLTNFHEFVFGSQKQNEETQSHQEEMITLSIPDDFELSDVESNLTQIDGQPVVYISGWLACTVSKGHDCEDCKLQITTTGERNDPLYKYIQLREWWGNKTSLTYPTANLCRVVETAIKLFERDILLNLHVENICELTATLFSRSCDTTWFQCHRHHNDIFKAIYQRLSRLLVRRQCQRINRSLALQDEKSIRL